MTEVDQLNILIARLDMARYEARFWTSLKSKTKKIRSSEDHIPEKRTL